MIFVFQSPAEIPFCLAPACTAPICAAQLAEWEPGEGANREVDVVQDAGQIFEDPERPQKKQN